MFRQLFLKAVTLTFALAFTSGMALARPFAHPLDDFADTLREDDGSIGYAFSYPDVYGDNFRNQRFMAPANCSLIGVLIAFGTRSGHALTTGDPSLVVQAWASGSDSFPANPPLTSDTLAFSAYSAHLFNVDSTWHDSVRNFVPINLTTPVALLDSQMFHVGYTAVLNSADDTLSILADVESGSNRSSEFYNGHFVLMSAGWRGINFLIRPIVSIADGIGVLEPDGSVKDFGLYAAYPNPFNPQTTIAFDLTHAQKVTLTVLDVLGRERATLADGIFETGRHVLDVNGAEWSSGVYFVRLQTREQSQTLKIVLEK